jgi:F-type H+-transporting ATPase subunit b
MEVIVQQIGAQVLSAVAAVAAPQQPTILDQIAELLKGSIPTALLFLVLVIAYEYLVHKPLVAILARRRALTEGAMEEAQRAVAEAEARTAEYAEKLRLARAQALKVREQRVKQWNGERDAALESARRTAHARVSEAKTELDAEAAAARKTIESAAADLASQAMRAVLPVAVGGTR